MGTGCRAQGTGYRRRALERGRGTRGAEPVFRRCAGIPATDWQAFDSARVGDVDGFDNRMRVENRAHRDGRVCDGSGRFAAQAAVFVTETTAFVTEAAVL
jgi:hypothetical protein